MKKLSLIIPVYNCENYLKECLDSIKKYITEDVEVIIVDDGSTDSSSEIYNQYNFCIYKNTNHGVSYSRNFGVEKACGEYIMFIDSDDYLSVNWNNIIHEELDKYKDSEMIIFSKEYRTNEKLSKEKIYDYIFQYDKSKKWMSPPWSKVYKREFLVRNKIRFNKEIINGEDMIYNALVNKNAKSISLSNKNIYNFRVNNASATKTFKEKIFISNNEFLNEILRLFKNSDLKEKYYSYFTMNSINMFIKKLSLIKYKEARKFFYVFGDKPYRETIANYKLQKNNKDKILLYLLKKKMYIIPILKEKLILLSKKVYRKIKGNEFIINV